MEHRSGGSRNKSHLQCSKYLCLMQWQQHKFRNFLCLFWIRVQPGGWALSLTYAATCRKSPDHHMPQLTGQLSPLGPEKGLSSCTSPTSPIPRESTESFKPQWCGTHEASPAMDSHCQLKSTWGEGGAVRSKNTQLEGARGSGNCRGAGCVQLKLAYCSNPAVPGHSSPRSPSSATARQNQHSLQDQLALGCRLEIPPPGCTKRFGGLLLAASQAFPPLTSPSLTLPRLSSSHFASICLPSSHNLAKFGCYVIHGITKFDKRPHPVFQFLSEPWDPYCTRKSKGREPPTVTYYTYGFLSISPFFKKPPSTPSLTAIDSIDQNNNLHLAAANLWVPNFERENVTDLHSQAGLWTDIYILPLHLWFPAGVHLLPAKFTINLSIVNDTQSLAGRERTMQVSILIPRRPLNGCDKHQ